VLTAGAERFVTTETFNALARTAPTDDPYPHLGRWEVLVVAPLTANTLARLAHGLADDVLTEAALAHDGPMLVAPAMNSRMWANPATQANVATLRDRHRDSRAGKRRSRRGRRGLGRMVEPDEISSESSRFSGLTGGASTETRSRLRGRNARALIGVLRGDRSSGRMGSRSLRRLGVAG
jgi:phosphopantothenoylcysteine decarboxylase/phosphopantothenate--cysteine ligase